MGTLAFEMIFMIQCISVHIVYICSLKVRMGAPTALCRLQDESIVFQLTFQRQSVGIGACSAVFIGMLREHAPYHCTIYSLYCI